ncbi:protein FAM200A-like [Aphis gossypii]|uniref:protein FAM200A-like n=1 Tax=Aphis gossypii TaxID=80765 RepID=UPI0021594B2B|nr:protein FAM200A-like [Aphis gossypii]
MGFTWYGNENCPQPECIVCEVKLFNAAMVPKESSEIMTFIMEHLTALEESIDKYFLNLDISEYDWINDPFDKNMCLTEFSLEEEEELAEIRNNRTLLLKYKNVSLNEFWIQVEKIHAEIGKKALKMLLQFSTSYLREQGFSTLVNIKSNKRMKMEFIEEEMRVCLSTIRPQIKDLCKKKQAQVSH